MTARQSKGKKYFLLIDIIAKVQKKVIIFAHHMNVEALFRQYYPRLQNYASQFIGDAFVADDIFQE